jgi:hypothetical protein
VEKSNLKVEKSNLKVEQSLTSNTLYDVREH